MSSICPIYKWLFCFLIELKEVGRKPFSFFTCFFVLSGLFGSCMPVISPCEIWLDSIFLLYSADVSRGWDLYVCVMFCSLGVICETWQPEGEHRWDWGCRCALTRWHPVTHTSSTLNCASNNAGSLARHVRISTLVYYWPGWSLCSILALDIASRRQAWPEGITVFIIWVVKLLALPAHGYLLTNPASILELPHDVG